jgi:hypothetical protein
MPEVTLPASPKIIFVKSSFVRHCRQLSSQRSANSLLLAGRRKINERQGGEPSRGIDIPESAAHRCARPCREGRTAVLWSWRRDSNPRPSDYKSDALPAELRQLNNSAPRAGSTSSREQLRGTVTRTEPTTVRTAPQLQAMPGSGSVPECTEPGARVLLSLQENSSNCIDILRNRQRIDRVGDHRTTDTKVIAGNRIGDTIAGVVNRKGGRHAIPNSLFNRVDT